MRTFTCDHCGHLVFFENTTCVYCGATLAFMPERMQMVALSPSTTQDGVWAPLSPTLRDSHPAVRMCRNRSSEGAACNFTTDADGAQPYCISCRQTRWLPNLGHASNQLRANKIENAKRFLFYTLSRLQLTTLQGLPAPVFDFLEELPGHPPVLTGHANGVITLNVAEADDDERTRRRLALFEPYRTLLGHLRHESGHFYWDILIRDTAWLAPFRALFGDERQDYAQALNHYYARHPVLTGGTQDNFISTYATAHPWEDWAESWAHYMHVMDLLETAADYQLQLSLPGQHERHTAIHNPFAAPDTPFETLWRQGVPLTLMLNSLNRSLGHQDAYPFALSPGAIAKLNFIHSVIGAHRRQWAASTLKAAAAPPTAPPAVTG